MIQLIKPFSYLVLIGSLFQSNLVIATTDGEKTSSATKKIDVVYTKKINVQEFNADPIQQYIAWREKMGKDNVFYPEAAILATVNDQGYPMSRTIVVKAVSPEGFIFSADANSNIAKQLKANPRASLLALWHDGVTKMSYQFRTEGLVQHLVTSDKHYILHHEQEETKVNWVTYILKPSHVQFSHLTKVDGTSVVEHINYIHHHKGWSKSIAPLYYVPVEDQH